MSEIEGARGAFESWLRRENGKWADKITERHADGRYCTLQAYMDWGAFQAGWLAALTSIDPDAIRAEARAEALWDAGSRAVEYVFFEGDNDPVDGNGFNAPMISSDGLRAAIANAEKPPCD